MLAKFEQINVFYLKNSRSGSCFVFTYPNSPRDSNDGRDAYTWRQTRQKEAVFSIDSMTLEAVLRASRASHTEMKKPKNYLKRTVEIRGVRIKDLVL